MSRSRVWRRSLGESGRSGRSGSVSGPHQASTRPVYSRQQHSYIHRSIQYTRYPATHANVSTICATHARKQIPENLNPCYSAPSSQTASPSSSSAHRARSPTPAQSRTPSHTIAPAPASNTTPPPGSDSDRETSSPHSQQCAPQHSDCQ